MAQATSDGPEVLWLERAARLTCAEALARQFVGAVGGEYRPMYGALALVLAVTTVDIFGLGALGYATTGFVPWMENPGSVVVVPGLCLVVVAVFSLEARYEAAVAALPAATDEDFEEDLSAGPRWFERCLSALGVERRPDPGADPAAGDVVLPRVRALLLAGGVAWHATWLAFSPAGGRTVFELQGPLIGALKLYGVVPLVYYPVGAELVALLFGLHVVFPFRIRRAALIDFCDSTRFGGLRPAGDLLRSSTVVYFLSLTLFVLFVAVTRGAGPTTAFNAAFVAAGTGVGVVLFLVPVYWLHVHVRRAKRAKVDAIADEVRAHSPTGRMFPETAVESPEHANRYVHEFIRLQQVEGTREYPVDVSILQQFVFALFLPYASTQAFDVLVTQVL